VLAETRYSPAFHLVRGCQETGQDVCSKRPRNFGPQTWASEKNADEARSTGAVIEGIGPLFARFYRRAINAISSASAHAFSVRVTAIRPVPFSFQIPDVSCGMSSADVIRPEKGFVHQLYLAASQSPRSATPACFTAQDS